MITGGYTGVSFVMKLNSKVAEKYKPGAIFWVNTDSHPWGSIKIVDIKSKGRGVSVSYRNSVLGKWSRNIWHERLSVLKTRIETNN